MSLLSGTNFSSIEIDIKNTESRYGLSHSGSVNKLAQMKIGKTWVERQAKAFLVDSYEAMIREAMIRQASAALQGKSALPTNIEWEVCTAQIVFPLEAEFDQSVAMGCTSNAYEAVGPFPPLQPIHDAIRMCEQMVAWGGRVLTHTPCCPIYSEGIPYARVFVVWDKSVQHGYRLGEELTKLSKWIEGRHRWSENYRNHNYKPKWRSKNPCPSDYQVPSENEQRYWFTVWSPDQLSPIQGTPYLRAAKTLRSAWEVRHLFTPKGREALDLAAEKEAVGGNSRNRR